MVCIKESSFGFAASCSESVLCTELCSGTAICSTIGVSVLETSSSMLAIMLLVKLRGVGSTEKSAGAIEIVLISFVVALVVFMFFVFRYSF